MAKDYQVVFEYTKEAGGFQGNRTRIHFEGTEDFNKWYTPNIQKRQAVIAQGVSNEEGIKLCMQTPVKCLFYAAVQASTTHNGEVHPEILRLELAKNLSGVPLEEVIRQMLHEDN